MATNYFLNQYFTTTLNVGGGIDASQTTGIIVQAVSGLDITKPGVACITYADPINTSTAEWVTYTSIDGSNELQGVTRGAEGFGAKTHSNGAVIAFPLSESHINTLATALSIGGVATNGVTTTLDEDDMASNSATALATQQSIKAYVDTYGQFSSMARQAIINGNFDVWQRGTSFTGTALGGIASHLFGYEADRWYSQAYCGSSGSGTFTLTVSRQTFTLGQTDVPNNPKYFHRFALSGLATEGGTGALLRTLQRIEGVDKFAGTTVTLTAWIKADGNRTFGVGGTQVFGTGGSPSASVPIAIQSINVTSSWQKFTLNFDVPSISGKTLGTANDDFVEFIFFYYSQGSVGTFATGTFDIAQVQLCAGSVALPFQPKSYEDEETACERYCQAFVADQTNGTIGAIGIAFNTAGAQLVLPLRRRMRTVPTLTATASDWKIGDSASSTDVTAMVLASAINSSSSVVLEVSASSVTQFRPYFLIGDGTANRTLILSAEL